MEYRAHQFLNKFVCTISSELVGLALVVGLITSITAVYCLIRLYNVMDVSFLLSNGVFVLTTLTIIIVLVSKAVKIHHLSEEIIKSFQNRGGSRLRVDYQFWKSCRPLRINVGSVGTIETHDFFLILFDNILTITINILLNF